jgi:cellobiose transport system permease protein
MIFRKMTTYILISVGGFLSLFPFYWLFIIGTRNTAAISQNPPVLTPGNLFFINFDKALNDIAFWNALLNSTYVSVIVTLSVLFFCSLAGFAFAKFHFPFKNALFVTIIVTLAVPSQLNLIPSYIIVVELGLLDQLLALIIPNMVTAFGIFWMRQYIQSSVHDELLESGKMDGCGYFRLYWNIAVPAILPAFATLGILTFLHSWNDFMWPLVVMKSADKFTIQIALRSLYALMQDMDYGKIMSATFVATLPLIIVFLIFRRYFISGLTTGAVKG